MKEILVGLDGSVRSETALRWALDEAWRRATGVHAVVACGPASRPIAVDNLAASIRAEDIERAGRLVLASIVERLGAARPHVPVTVSAVNDEAAPALVQRGKDASMLVVGDRGHSAMRRLWLGSVTNACLHGASVPVAVVRPGMAGGPTRPVVVGVDSSASSVAALRWAAAEARLRHVRLHVVHVFQVLLPGLLAYYPVVGLSAEKVALSELRAIIDRSLPDRGDLEITTEVATGPIAPMLMNRARKGQLLVVGSRGKGGFTELLLGSTSHQCANHHHGPIVVVPTGRDADREEADAASGMARG